MECILPTTDLKIVYIWTEFKYCNCVPWPECASYPHTLSHTSSFAAPFRDLCHLFSHHSEFHLVRIRSAQVCSLSALPYIDQYYTFMYIYFLFPCSFIPFKYTCKCLPLAHVGILYCIAIFSVTYVCISIPLFKILVK